MALPNHCSWTIFALILLALTVEITKSDQSLEVESNILKAIFKNYDRSIRPAGPNGTGPVNVEVNVYIRSITNIDDVKMNYETQLTFRQSWVDERLKYDPKGLRMDYVTLTDAGAIWIPDIFFSNERSGQFHNIVTPNTLIRIFPDGRLLYSTRISLNLFCPMDLRNYPLDKQMCKITAASYGYTTKDIKFVWKNTDPVQVTKVLYLQKFTLEKFYTDYCTSKTNTGEYSCVKIELLFSRNFHYYFILAYIPTASLVFLSWVTFWLNPRYANIRLGLWVGILVSIMILTMNINANNPQVSYTKAIDVWTGACITFIFSVLLELCLVANVLINEEAQGLPLSVEDSTGEKKESGKRRQARSYSSFPLRWLNRYPTRAQRIDVISRFIFPTAFAFFNFVYWVSYGGGNSVYD